MAEAKRFRRMGRSAPGEKGTEISILKSLNSDIYNRLRGNGALIRHDPMPKAPA